MPAPTCWSRPARPTSPLVDFRALGRRALAAGAAVYGPVSQATFLGRLGIELRLRALVERATPEQARALTPAARG